MFWKIDCFVGTVTRSITPIASAVFKLGGKPVFVSHVVEPKCERCGQNMDFIAQIPLKSPLKFSKRFAMAYLFMCPGKFDERVGLECETWEAFSGANAVILQEDHGRALIAEGPHRYVDYEVRLQRLPEPNVDVTDERISERVAAQVSEDTKIGGVPAWLQMNETPACPKCGLPMRFVAQISAEPDGPLPADAWDAVSPASSRWDDATPAVPVTAASRRWDDKNNHAFFDFGDVGLGYVFVCARDCTNRGAFLWQCS